MQPVTAAARDGDLAGVRRALDGGGDATAVPLREAALGGHEEVVRLLLARGAAAEVDAENRRGGTALLFACHRGHTGTARALLDAGADPARESFVSGLTPLESASRYGHLAVARLLLERGAAAALRSSTVGHSSGTDTTRPHMGQAGQQLICMEAANSGGARPLPRVAAS
jgi:ankyrin repeat protein